MQPRHTREASFSAHLASERCRDPFIAASRAVSRCGHPQFTADRALGKLDPDRGKLRAQRVRWQRYPLSTTKPAIVAPPAGATNPCQETLIERLLASAKAAA